MESVFYLLNGRTLWTKLGEGYIGNENILYSVFLPLWQVALMISPSHQLMALNDLTMKFEIEGKTETLKKWQQLYAKDKLIFRGTLFVDGGEQELILKICRRYGIEVHKALCHK